MRSRRILGAVGAASFVVAGGVANEARADFAPGDVLAGMEFVVQGGPGRVYRVNDGGDLTTVVPDVQMPDDNPVIDICSTDDGRVLAATSTHHTIFEVTTGTPVVFATIPTDASSLYCGDGKIFVASLLETSAVYEITAGGDVTGVYAQGINRGLVGGPDGKLWGSNFTGLGGGGGIYRDIVKGSNFTGKAPFIELTDVFAATLRARRVFITAATNDAIADVTDGLPQFAFAIVPGVRGITNDAGVLWASTIDGAIFQPTMNHDFTGETPYAKLPGPSLSMAVVEKCGDGQVHGREECDEGGPTELCSAACKEARCGDGVMQPSLLETCDDGNETDGDGCSANCSLETQPTSTTSSVTSGSTSSSSSSTTSSGTGGSGGASGDSEGGCSFGDGPKNGAPFALVAGLVGLIAAGARGRRR